MKQIVGIIKPFRLEAVEQALHAIDHFPGFTLLNGKGHGRGSGIHHSYAPTEWAPARDCNLLIIYCSDTQADEIVETIKKAAYTGNPSDGVIAVCNVETILRIRTGEQNDDAV
ncbi:nitrogen regulatory protein P-II 1 [Massilia varians]|uniref:Nitrogen regulatory protein P-II 1 n=1 Tax=Massilia varians TaxID=457921 RepID=A0ABM8C7J4_9BURK|nr:P-II family nitrogen regulator [Massilia varians]BDT59207.1 nitrogen regulatory protein P-II 1 [Massilia varians]